MPYTPPSQQSPASSSSSSPAISRTSSYHEDIPRSPSGRVQPPRSMSSASYLHKHRRSPSMTKVEIPPTPAEDSRKDSPQTETTDFAKRSSLKQSPPPVNNLRIPTGAVISPPDSSENSDDDKNLDGQRGRELEKNWQQLQLAVRALPQPRDSSLERVGQKDADLPVQADSVPVTTVTSPTALSAEARKISHSRSSTETKLAFKAPTFADSTTCSDDSEEDDPASKPALVRKKSGELVKPALRPSSRRRYSSMPGTPTYSKSVHFNDNDNQTRHFLQVDKPIAVSAGTSPVDSYDSDHEFPFDGNAKPELQIRIASFPEDTHERRCQPIRVERIVLSQDKDTLIGTCAVHNIAFQKSVTARFTLDYWKTTSEVNAEYSNTSHTDGCDRFTFHIRLADQANIASKTMLLCVRYNVGGQEHWDNNMGTNYQIDFSQTKPVRVAKKPASQTGSSTSTPRQQAAAPPRSRPKSPLPRSKSHDSIDENYLARLDADFDFGGLGDGDTPSSIKLKPRPKRSPMFTIGPPSSPHNGLGSRYDFGTSLSAALTTAQDKLGRDSGLLRAPPARSSGNGSYFSIMERKEPAKPATPQERPGFASTERPAIGSEQYKDLVQKFCYVGSNRSPLANA